MPDRPVRVVLVLALLIVLDACGGSGSPSDASSPSGALPSLSGRWLGSSEGQAFTLSLTETPYNHDLLPHVSGFGTCLDSSGLRYGETWPVQGSNLEFQDYPVDLRVVSTPCLSQEGEDLWFWGRWAGSNLIAGYYLARQVDSADPWAGPHHPFELRRQ
jgi:hypothetical protein